MIVPSSENYILTEESEQVLHSSDISDPLRQWAYGTIDPEWWTGELWGVVGVGDPIYTHQNAKYKVMNIIKSIINYALWMVSLIALIYLIYHGFLIVTAAGDDTQYKKGLKGIKYAAIAMVGIGVSRLIVSWIFRLINLIIW